MNFFIFCPSGAETGGVEALHQLHKAIEAEGESVYMVYVGDNAIDDDPNWVENAGFYIRQTIPTERYKRSYGDFDCVLPLSRTREFFDAPDSVCVFPDIWQKAGVHLKHALPCVWMLAAYQLEGCWQPKFRSGVYSFDKPLVLCQSRYAKDMLERQFYDDVSPETLMLTDYLTPCFEEAVPLDMKLDRLFTPIGISYYGGRGKEAALWVLGSDIPASQIFGLPETLTAQSLLGSRYFLYPARQPGMDRMPREAAACGCVVYVLAEGAGAFFEDCPLPDEFRLPTLEALRGALVQALSEGDEGYRRRWEAQRYYRKFAREMKPKFISEVQNFIRVADRMIQKGC